jgi:polyisoprenoid-binding protein YceI
MSLRARRIVIGLVAALVVAVVAGFAVLKLTGNDAPPPPTLEGKPATSAPAGDGRLAPVAGSFVGYRVNEQYLGIGVRTAVGRTGAVTGTVTLDGRRVHAADLRADMTKLRSDQARRDDALRYRGIETDRFPTARFTLGAPFTVSAAPHRTTGRLTLHGRSAPITITVRGQLEAGGRLELVGSAPIRFATFAIKPPSVAGIVTVRDHGLLEFRLALAQPRA